MSGGVRGCERGPGRSAAHTEAGPAAGRTQRRAFSVHRFTASNEAALPAGSRNSRAAPSQTLPLPPPQARPPGATRAATNACDSGLGCGLGAPAADAVCGSGSSGGGGGVTVATSRRGLQATWLTQRRLLFLDGVSATEKASSSPSQRSTMSGRTATSQKFLG